MPIKAKKVPTPPKVELKLPGDQYSLHQCEFCNEWIYMVVNRQERIYQKFDKSYKSVTVPILLKASKDTYLPLAKKHSCRGMAALRKANADKKNANHWDVKYSQYDTKTQKKHKKKSKKRSIKGAGS